jgi:hypothetical protein
MADIRGIPTTEILAMGRLLLANAHTGLTVGRRYWPLAVGVDAQPSPPVVYVLVPNDAGAIVAIPASAFTFQVDNANP